MSGLAWAGLVLGAAVGAPLRLFVDRWAAKHWRGSWPFGTFIVNTGGSLLAGYFAASLSQPQDATWIATLSIGLCGSLTTFGGLCAQIVDFIGSARTMRSIGYLAASLIAGFVAVSIGYLLAAI